MDDFVPEDVMAFWKSKDVVTPDQFMKLENRVKAKAFSVAKATDENAVKRIYNSLSDALEKGMTAKEWANSVGSGDLTAAYMETVFRTNIQTALQAGRNANMFSAEGQSRAPYVMWNTTGGNCCDTCDELDGQVFDKSSYDLQGMTPPIHYNCGCSLIELDEQDIKDGGYSIGSAKDYAESPDILFDNRDTFGWL